MKIKVDKATPLQLDYLVAKCKGFNAQLRHDFLRQKAAATDYEGKGDDLQWMLDTTPNDLMWVDGTGVTHFIERYTTDWAAGGLIIGDEHIEFKFHDCVVAGIWYRDGIGRDECNHKQVGSTPLIAAMRTYIASKLGDEVEVPEELT